MTETMKKPSSRLMRMTDEDRPFTRDFKDLFSTLTVSLKLRPRRVRFSKFDFTFTVEEALVNLSALRFTQSARMPDPKDPNRVITTTSTTTFTMSKEMAQSILQSFCHARFIECLNGNPESLNKGTICHPTHKGLAVLQRFCNRNGVTAPHVMRLLQSSRNKMTLLILERDLDTDKLLMDRATVEVIFRRFAGTQSPGARAGEPAWDDRADYPNGLVGVEGTRELRANGRKYRFAFTGRSAVNWLMDCCTTIDPREPYRICEQFIEHGLITAVVEDKSYVADMGLQVLNFQPTRQAVYAYTERAFKVCGWSTSDRASDQSNKSSSNSKVNLAATGMAGGSGAAGLSDISNKTRLTYILSDPSLRLLFREHLSASFCEENLAFYMDITEYLDRYNRSKQDGDLNDRIRVQDYVASAFNLYNAFLAPGSPCELNIDHSLRNRVAREMTGLSGDGQASVPYLDEVVNLFRIAQVCVFKLMVNDSVPKFFRDPKYTTILQEHDFESTASLPGRSDSPIPTPERSTDRLSTNS